MTSLAGLPFSPSPSRLGNQDAPTCGNDKGAVQLERFDNTGRPLAFTNAGTVTDATETGGAGTLLDATEKTPANHLACFDGLVSGQARWHWREDPAGEHLIGLDTLSKKLRFVPGETLNEGVSVDVIPGVRKARAIHLPPPVLINLREDGSPGEDLLAPEQLAYFQANGNNALLFIHGYNVPHGGWGRFLKGQSRSHEWHGNVQSFRQRAEWHPYPATVWQDLEALSDTVSAPLEESELNGTGAHNWAVNMEYRLNRAAGFDGRDWTPYSRIINISWPGDTGATDFMQAELNAMAAGRRLVPLLQQLHASGIALNIITHSLGARVALTALNILGAIGHRNLLDHLFLWQPAVADNALTNDASRDVHPLGLGVFPAAHQAARNIVVLHSKEDGILGPGGNQDQEWWKRSLRALFMPPGLELWNLATAEDPLDDILGHLHGAYDKKWWTFPSFLDNGFGPAIETHYADYLPLHPDVGRGRSPRSTLAHRERVKRQVAANWERLERDILAEARALWQPCTDCLRQGQRPPRYTLLAPMNHQPAISTDKARHYVQRLKKLALNRWVPERSPRPALGHLGLDGVAGENAIARDPFLEKLMEAGEIDVVDQSPWLFSHSGMRIPSDDLFRHIYQREIMSNRLLANSRFGRY